MGELSARVVAITGGGGGIGRADALRLTRAGATVMLGDLDEAQVEEVAAEVRAAGGDCIAARLDVTDEGSVAAFLERAAALHDRLDALVNNAGIFNSRPFREMSRADWQRMLDINLTGTFLCTREALRYMVPRGQGAIVSMSSGLGVRGGAEVAHYAATKAALIGLTRSLALEFGGAGIRVNAIAPGVVDTPMPRGVMTEEQIASLGAQAPLGRIATAEDIADTVLYLLSDASRHVTGQTIHVNGGGYFA